MTLQRNTLIGYSSALSYALTSALARVFIQKMGLEIAPLLVLFLSLLITVVYFHFRSLLNLFNTYRQAFKYKTDLFLVNLFTGIMWTSFFLGPDYVGAEDYTIFVFAMGGIVGAGVWFYQHKKNIGVVTTIALLYLIALLLPLLNEKMTYTRLFGFFLAALSGVCLFLFLKYSGQLQKKTGLSTTETLSVRWWLGIAIIAVLSMNQWNQIPQMTSDLYIQILAVAFLGIVIPAFLSQTATIRIGPQISAILQSLTPFLTVICTTLIIGKGFSLLSIIASTLIFIAVLIFQLSSYKCLSDNH